MQKQKGFTIIELIVVIAIIAVLAAIVLVNVTTYINKGKDATAMANLATLVVNGTKYFDQHGSYFGWINLDYLIYPYCEGSSDPSFLSVCKSLMNAGYGPTNASCYPSDPHCTSASTNWCAFTYLKADSTKTYCVDSTGTKKIATGSAGWCNINTGTCN
jgi:prepilin-type N-terminal cleavage/methylation domain-containing protein